MGFAIMPFDGLRIFRNIISWACQGHSLRFCGHAMGGLRFVICGHDIVTLGGVRLCNHAITGQGNVRMVCLVVMML